MAMSTLVGTRLRLQPHKSPSGNRVQAKEGISLTNRRFHSQKSGVSKLAERVGDLKVQTTRFVEKDVPTKRGLKNAFEQGLSSDAIP